MSSSNSLTTDDNVVKSMFDTLVPTEQETAVPFIMKIQEMLANESEYVFWTRSK